MTFKAILQALEEGRGLKFIDVSQNFKIFIRKKCNKTNYLLVSKPRKKVTCKCA